MDKTLNNPKDKGEKRDFFPIAQLYDSYFFTKTNHNGQVFYLQNFFHL